MKITLQNPTSMVADALKENGTGKCLIGGLLPRIGFKDALGEKYLLFLLSCMSR